jgi:hypothetical protein
VSECVWLEVWSGLFDYVMIYQQQDGKSEGGKESRKQTKTLLCT